MRFKATHVVQWALFLAVYVLGTCKGQACQPRNHSAALTNGRFCSSTCVGPGDKANCYKTEDCLCDHECGFSCIDKGSSCPTPDPIPNISRIKVTRTADNGSLVPVLEPPYVYDDLLEYLCAPGFKLSLQVKHLCEGFGGWTNPNQPVCVRACGLRNEDAIFRGELLCGAPCLTDEDCPAEQNQQCLCEDTCGSNCVDPNVDCGEAETTRNCAIEYVGEGIERFAHYVCDDGFYLYSGSPSRKCTGAGTYDGVLPTCSKIECGDPFSSISAPDAGGIPDYVPGPYFVGANLTFSCPSTHRLLGDRTRTCLENGLWSGVPVVCDLKDNLIRCPQPGVPINGRLLTSGGNFSVGSTVEFECECGFLMIGLKRQECLYYLQWSGVKAPECIDPRYADRSIAGVDTLLEDINDLNSVTNDGSVKNNAEVYLLIDISHVFADGGNLFKESIQFLVNLLKQVTKRYHFGIVAFGTRVEVVRDINQAPINNTQAIAILKDVERDKENLRTRLGVMSDLQNAISAYEKMAEESKLAQEKIFRKVFVTTNGRMVKELKLTGVRKVAKNVDKTFNKELLQISVVITCNDCKKSLNNLLVSLRNLATSSERIILNRDSNALPNLLEKRRVAMIRTIPLEELPNCGESENVGDIIRQTQTDVISVRVIGGNPTQVGSWPWQVAIAIKTRPLEILNGTKGGGSVLSNSWILTAAHMFGSICQANDKELRIKDFNVIMGTHNLELTLDDFTKDDSLVRIFEPETIHCHENFSPGVHDYDIALIKLGREMMASGNEFVPRGPSGWVTFNPRIRPVCLPCSTNGCIQQDPGCMSQGSKFANIENALHVVTGFGHSDNNPLTDSANAVVTKHLQQGVVRLRDREECRTAIGRPEIGGLPFTDRMVCALGLEYGQVVDACFGDSGGPLIREVFNEANTKSTWMQVGIVSFGIGCGLTYTHNGSKQHYPGYYTDVFSFLPWLKRTMNNEKCSCPGSSAAVMAENQRCLTSCASDQDCSGFNEKCLCDDACGKSCIDPDMTCETLSPILNGKIVGDRTFGSTVNYSCDPGFGLVGEKSRTCRSDQTWSGEVPTCEVSEKSCFGSGDPHYRTFDGKYFDFHGICSYALVRYTNQSSPKMFVVEVDNEHRGTNKQVSWLRKVYVRLDSLRIEFNKGKVVKIDDTVINLPFHHTQIVKSIQLNGRFVELQTTFGVRVLYDGDTYIKVVIPSELFGSVEGLGGDADGDPENDFKEIKSGAILNDPNQFGDQFRTETKTQCSPDPPPSNPPCEPDKVFQFSQSCSILVAETGCFADCHDKVPPEEFMKNCLVDACAYDDATTAIDNIVGAYAQICQSLGIIICSEWRKQTGTELVCPENSHYSPCASTCPQTCLTLGNESCSETCLEGCDCDQGFVYSGDTCVPVAQCGCVYQDRYYKDLESLMSPSCDEVCVCENNTMNCDYHRCTEQETCGKDHDGLSACVPKVYGVSTVWGDPHYMLFDGSGWFDFMGVCSYYLVKTPRMDRFDPRWFEIIAQNEHRHGNTKVSYLQFLTINLAGGALVVTLEKNKVARINGEIVQGFTSDEFKVQPSGRANVLTSKFGLEVSFDGNEARIKISTTYWNEVHGLCGNFNGDKSDDLEMASGEQAQTYGEMAESYTVGSCSAEFTEQFVCSPSDRIRWSSERFCGSLTKRNGVFSACHDVIDAEKFFQKCLFDVCATEGDQQVFKEALETYAGECQKGGIALCSWKQLLNIEPVNCPEHSHFDGCAAPCIDTCQSPYAASNCEISGNVESCVCDPGYVSDGGVCVRRTQCGCVINGNYVTKGGQVHLRVSNKDCTCLGIGKINCACSNKYSGGSCDSWDLWSQWGNCKARCGELGTMMRTRICPEGDCPISEKEEKVCNGPRCAFARGELSLWGPWLGCSATCGSQGRQYRLRRCVGSSCRGSRIATRSCAGSDCSINWSSWQTWQSCTAKCDEAGARMRSRGCLLGGCPRELTEDRQSCNGPPCPVWSQWTPWVKCSASCNDRGMESRERKCKRGSCVGLAKEERPCFGPICKSVWSDWTPWSSCSAFACDQEGTKSRSRRCLSGSLCSGVPSETRPCRGPVCPPVWRDWSPWSSCSGNCEKPLGTRERSRTCISGSCRFTGLQTDQKSCSRKCEPIWNNWNPWSICSGKCEQRGTQTRKRTCLQGTCLGLRTSRRPCIGSICTTTRAPITTEAPTTTTATTIQTTPPVGCGYQAVASRIPQSVSTPGYPSPYSNNLKCVWIISAPPGLRIRLSLGPFNTEDCCDYLNVYDGFNEENLLKRFQGTYLQETVESTGTFLRLQFFSDETVVRNGFNATFIAFDPDPSTPPITTEASTTPEANSVWSPWSQWSSCPASCGKQGIQTRSRRCIRGPCLTSGNRVQTERRTCNGPVCQSVYGPWTKWSSCPASCGQKGTETRTRRCVSGPCLQSPNSVQTQERPCNGPICPSVWSPWAQWSSCPASCGKQGIQTRSRRCIRGPCLTSSNRVQTERRTCNGPVCQSVYGPWTRWSSCPASCGQKGTETRTRRCVSGPCLQSPNPVQTQERPCNGPICPSVWSPWSQWSPCPASCGKRGIQTRSRRCIRGPCLTSGNRVQTERRTCNGPVCQSVYGPWTRWSSCPASCDQKGIETRTRRCVSGPCLQSPNSVQTQERPCNGPICPSVWSPWSQWSSCPASCSKQGIQTRSRRCIRGPCLTSGNRVQTERRTCNGPVCQSVYGPWTRWSSCPASCGQKGTETRTRRCVSGPCLQSPNPVQTQERPCNGPICPSVWSPWSQWSPCPASCGKQGIQTRSRRCIRGPCLTSGNRVQTERRTCNGPVCQSVYGPWTRWSSCPASCGQKGIETRTRRCVSGPCLQSPNSVQTQERPCNGPICPSVWSPWSQWSPCPASCGKQGIQTRSRRCIRGPCLTSGNRVQTERRTCNGPVCQSVYGPWTRWSSCPASCGQKGTETRTRRCVSGPCLQSPNSVQTQERPCNGPICPSVWSPWSQWTPCPASCGKQGIQTRSRRCIRGPCLTSDKKVQTERRTCNGPVCQSVYSPWTRWSSCPASCGQKGTETRTRRCVSGPCLQSPNSVQTQERPCNGPICPSVWSPWSQWSPCPASCGKRGIQTRSRRCIRGPCLTSGNRVQTERRTCNGPVCQSVYGPWTRWSSCPASCGQKGTETRTRRCVSGPCLQSPNSVQTQERPCNGPICPSVWSPWSQWSSCPASCGKQAIQTRSRRCIRGPCLTSGNRVQTERRTCNGPVCQSGWSIWTRWSSCRASCGKQGVQTRSRRCVTGVCLRLSNKVQTERRPCNGPICVQAWGKWSPWTRCSARCGRRGSRTRKRTCLSNSCPGSATQLDFCNGPTCQIVTPPRIISIRTTPRAVVIRSTVEPVTKCVDKFSWCAMQKQHCLRLTFVKTGCPKTCSTCPKWSAWRTSSCSVTCGVGTQRRSRICLDNQNKTISASSCPGSNSDLTSCTARVCSLRTRFPGALNLPGPGFV